MKKFSKKTAKSLFAVLVVMLLCVTGLIQTVAANADASVLICVAIEGESSVEAVSGGIPFIAGNNQRIILTSASLDIGDGYSYYGMNKNDKTASGLVSLELLGEGVGGNLAWSSDDLSSTRYFTTATADINEELSIIVHDEDNYPVLHPCILDGYEKTDDGYYLMDLRAKSFAEETTWYYPLAVVNADNELVGIVSFMEDGDTPVVYATVKPDYVPETTAPEDTTSGSNGSSSGNPSRPVDDDTDTTDDNKTDSKKTVIIAGVAGGVVLLAVVIFILLKKKNKPEPVVTETAPVIEDLGVTTPVIEESSEEEMETWAPTQPEEEIKPYILVESGPFKGHEYHIAEWDILIGRAKEATIRYSEEWKKISGNHCKITMHDGVLSIIDLGSTNGTFLEGYGQLPPNMPYALKEGDRFYLSTPENMFRIMMK